MQKDYIGTLYTGVSDAFQAGLCPIARCLKAEKYDLAAVEIIKLTERIDMKNDLGKIAKQASKQASNAECRLGNLNGATGGSYAGQVYDQDYLCPTLTDMQGGGRQPHIVEVKKLNDVNFVYGRDADVERLCNAVKDEEQHLCKLNKMPQGELSSLDDAEICDIDAPVASTVTAENIPSVIELGNPDFYNFLYEIDGDIYLIRIRKLIPKECWRLMNFSDEDFEKAAAVNSNTQLYKQAGNSIVKNVLVAIMGQLFDGKEDVYRTV